MRHLHVTNGGADRVELLGIDRWIEGAHLKGLRCAWRWNREQRILERS